MALDDALLTRARETGETVLRVYTWSVPTLSFGRNQRARDGYDRRRLAADGVGVVRRPTGGRALLHDREVTYSVTGPTHAGEPLGESYRRINRLLVEALRSLGAEVSVVARAERGAPPATAIDRPGLLPCFHHPSPGEIVVEGRKLAGSAQMRHDGSFLQHGSILVDDDQSRIADWIVDDAARDLFPPAATLREVLGVRPSFDRVATALFDAVRSLEDPGATALEPDASLLECRNQRRTLYLDDAWTWRR